MATSKMISNENQLIGVCMIHIDACLYVHKKVSEVCKSVFWKFNCIKQGYKNYAHTCAVHLYCALN